MTADDAGSVPWPQWMLRYIGANNQQAMMDLVWSVGGSPPYGGISYEEGAAVYELIESHRGPGAASPAAFAAVRSLIGARQDALAALEAFECYDAIVTSPESIDGALAQRGLEVAEGSSHDGARAGFLALAGQARLQDGDVAGAAELFQDALAIFAPLAAEDGVYEERLAATAQNAISLAANSGDVATARYLFGEVGELVAEPGRSALRSALGM
jgi:hypothetical protein